MSRSRGASSAAQSLHHQPDGTQAGRKTVEPMDELSEYEMEVSVELWYADCCAGEP